MRISIWLTALAAVFVFGLACGGGSSDTGPPPAPTTSLSIRANKLKFDHRTLAAPANSDVNLLFVNDDSGVLHNFAVYTNKSVKEKIFGSPITTGKKTETYSFRTPGPGTYYFRCDVHPDMNGRFIVE